MCDLLGLAFNLPVEPTVSFRNFRFKDRCNSDGWGIGWYEDGQVRIEKEPDSATESPRAAKLLEQHSVHSSIIIAHVRAASRGSNTLANTHPFARDNIIFAHNGTLSGLPSCEDGDKPEGNTDSELAFCLLLNWAKEEEIDLYSSTSHAWIEEKFRALNKYGNLNALLSNGKQLFCYADKNGYNKLSIIYRRAPFSKVKLLDESRQVRENSFVDLNEDKRPEQKGAIVATTERTGPPTDEDWQPLESGKLLVLGTE